MRMVRSLPDAPRLADATRESKLLGKLDLPNVMRPADQRVRAPAVQGGGR
jgi:hypothetical protein